MIPRSRGHRAEDRVGSVSVKRRVAPRFPPITTHLGSGGSVLAICGFETATRELMSWRSCFQFGSLRDKAQCHVAPKYDQQLACHRDDGDASDLATPAANAFMEPSTESAARLVPQPQPVLADPVAARRTETDQPGRATRLSSKAANNAVSCAWAANRGWVARWSVRRIRSPPQTDDSDSV